LAARPNACAGVPTTDADVYAAAYETYRDGGWSPIKLWAGTKFPPPVGFTGHDGADPSFADMYAWAESEPGGNIAVRLNKTVIGIDVDAYDDKTGGQTLAEAERRWGTLPPTPRSSSRVDDPVSGIRLYRVPAGTRLVTTLGFPELGLGSIEIVQRHHRYVVCWPSVHPSSGQTYQWYGPDGAVIDPPAVDDLPDLPADWLAGMREDKPAELLTDERADIEECLTDGSPSPRVAERLTAALAACAGSNRHDETRNHVLALLRFGRQKEPGVRIALTVLGQQFVAAVAPDRDGGTAEAAKEYGRMVYGDRAAALLAEPSYEDWFDNIGKDNGEASPHSGQVRMAYRLAEAHADNLLYVHGIGWHYWDKKRWAYDDVGAANRAVLAVLRQALSESIGDAALRADVKKCESHNGITGVLGVASALEVFATTVRDLDPDPYLLNVANGTLDLRTMELAPHSPAHRITKVARAAYDPQAAGANWTAHIARVLPDDTVRGYLQRTGGLALLGRVRDHVLPILTGTGANGKGTTYKALCWALGDYASTAEPDLFMHRDGAHPTGEMDLMGQRLVVVAETEKDRRLAEATMKRLIGGDTIRARRMRQDFVEFEPSHTPILVTNHLPKVSGDDPAIWRRIRVIPFDVAIPEGEQDGDLDERLQVECDAVLAWVVAGWNAYRECGLDEPLAVLAATDKYRVDSDAIARFIADCCSTAETLQVETGQLFDRWERWRVTDGSEAVSQKAFGQALDSKGYRALKSTGGRRFRKGLALLESGE
jgi:putative DNA primase/helicase